MTIPSAPIPSPEVKAILKTWVALQKEKYGENWKEILAKEMTADIRSIVERMAEGKLPEKKS